MSKFLEDMAQFCREQELNIYFIGAVEDGKYEAESIAVNRTNYCSDIYSCAKAFTVTAVGLMVDRGLMSTDEKVADILGDLCPDEMDVRWRDTTVDMVLRHHGWIFGYRCTRSYEFYKRLSQIYAYRTALL